MRHITGSTFLIASLVFSPPVSALDAGTVRDNFVAQSIKSCTATANAAAKAADQTPPPEVVEKYCRCMAAKEADALTQSDLDFIAKNHLPPDAYMAAITKMVPLCRAEAKQ